MLDRSAACVVYLDHRKEMQTCSIKTKIKKLGKQKTQKIELLLISTLEQELLRAGKIITEQKAKKFVKTFQKTIDKQNQRVIIKSERNKKQHKKRR